MAKHHSNALITTGSFIPEHPTRSFVVLFFLPVALHRLVECYWKFILGKTSLKSDEEMLMFEKICYINYWSDKPPEFESPGNHRNKLSVSLELLWKHSAAVNTTVGLQESKFISLLNIDWPEFHYPSRVVSSTGWEDMGWTAEVGRRKTLGGVISYKDICEMLSV